MNFSRRIRRSFTLIELMVVVVIIGVLATTVLFAMYGALENAKRVRTQAVISRLDSMLMSQWDSYKSRAIRLRLPAQRDPINVAAIRLTAVRDLMRMEMPDRISDLMDGPVAIPVSGSSPVSISTPSLWRAYRRRAGFSGGSPPASWTGTHQGSECLYLIISMIRDGDTSGLDFLKESEIGDIDEDGMPEILDAWGRPIEFLRWAPGYSISAGADLAWGVAGKDDDGKGGTDDINERGATGSDDELISELQFPSSTKSPDPFDPLHVDDDLRVALKLPPRVSFALKPLLFSAGPDNVYDIVTDGSTAIRYGSWSKQLANDPFYVIPPPSSGGIEKQLGLPWDISGDGDQSVDNITNHFVAE